MFLICSLVVYSSFLLIFFVRCSANYYHQYP